MDTGRQWIPLPKMGWKSAKGQKGSVYSRNSNGTVTRTKTNELQAEQAKRGINQEQTMTMDNTRFVHPDNHKGLVYAKMHGSLVKDGVIHRAIPWGKGATEPVPMQHVSMHPAVGWIPVEWNHAGEDGRHVTHLGHPIESVD